MTPQAILRARFAELAIANNVLLAVRKQGDKFYFVVTGSYDNTSLFIRSCFPKAWMTSGATEEITYGLPAADVAHVLKSNVVDPIWLMHQNGTAERIARSIREESAFDRLPILADALLEAGCQHAEMLAHCKANEPHRGTCWVVELLLGPAPKQRRPRVT